MFVPTQAVKANADPAGFMTARNTARIMNLVSVLSWTNHPMYAMAVSLKRRVKKTMLTIRHIKRSVLMNTNYLQAERVSEQQ
jgi:hypothetical protein